MPLTAGRQSSTQTTRSGSAPAATSPALQWLWKYLSDAPNPQILDCGPVFQATVDVLLRRGAKIHVADLVTSTLKGEARLWDRSGKVPVFRVSELLAQFPEIPQGSLTVILGWHLLDLLPRAAHAEVVGRWLSYLQPGGALFCLLREPYLPKGAETLWWLETLNTLASSGEGRKPFPYPAITNREMERLVLPGSVKTFLTRAGRREVLAIVQP
jgi:hypothetical protein